MPLIEVKVFEEALSDSLEREMIKGAGDTVLRDGTKVYIRPIRPSDEDQLLTFFRNLSDTSKWLRFFSQIKDEFLVTEAHREATLDRANTFGLIATLTGHGDERIIAHAFYVNKGDGHAETAFTVADEFQGRGLGTLLLYRLACTAAERGIRVFEADILPVNQRMLEVLRHSGFKISTQIESGQIHIEFPIYLCGPNAEDANPDWLNESQQEAQNGLPADFTR